MNQTPGNTTAQKQRYWTKIIIQARAHPDPDGVSAYCASHNVSINNYYKLV